MPGISPFNTSPIFKSKKSSWSSYWKTQNIFDFLWMGDILGNELIDVSGNANNVLIANKDFATNYIPSVSAATFAIPDVVALRADDTDLFWTDATNNILQKSVADLVASDYERTIIKYDNAAPHNVIWIGILKHTAILTVNQIDKLHESFELWLYWTGLLNAYGVIKENRTILSIPTLLSALINNDDRDKVVLTYNQALDETSVPDVSAFTLAGKTISNIVITGADVVITVTNAYAYGEIVTIDYIQPVVHMLKSAIGKYKVGSFTSQAVINNISDPHFKITVDTRLAGSASNTFVMPIIAGADGDYYINWGDGSEEHFTGTGSRTHVYAIAGIYQIQLRGWYWQAVRFNNTGDRLKLLSIDRWGETPWAGMLSAFFGCSNMEANYNDIPIISNQAGNRTIKNIFQNCSKFNGSVAGWDVSFIEDMSGAFAGCTVFNQSFSSWDTSAVQQIWWFARNCYALKGSFASFNMSSILAADQMLAGVNINEIGSTANYDATLISWASQSLHSAINFHGGTSKYSDSGAAARLVLTNAPNSWVITDGGHV